MVDVGEILDDGTFDLADIAETEQLLLKTDEAGVVRTRLMYKNEEQQTSRRLLLIWARGGVASQARACEEDKREGAWRCDQRR